MNLVHLKGCYWLTLGFAVWFYHSDGSLDLKRDVFIRQSVFQDYVFILARLL